MAIYETQANRTRQRAVAKACLLARQILGHREAYNERAEGSESAAARTRCRRCIPEFSADLLDGQGLAHHDFAARSICPTACRAAQRRREDCSASTVRHSVSSCFQTAIEGTTEEELDEFLLRYNFNGVELNEEGFQKLSEEISLSASEAIGIFPWGRERVTFYSGLVPVGETLEPLLIRKGYVRQLLPDGKIGAAGSRAYYEVCAESVLQDLPGANGRGDPRKP